MAIALIAGLPPIMGLYASFAPIIVYALLGTSKHMAIGPVALISMLVASSITPFAAPESEQYIALAVLLALLVGALQVMMGLANFGYLVNFLSKPVISGFTSAAAIIIILTQLRNLLGIEIPRTHYVHEIFYHIWQNRGNINIASLLIGTTSVLTLIFLGKWKSSFPRALLVVSVSACAVHFFNLHEAGVKTVGFMQSGIHGLSLPDIDISSVSKLLFPTIAIALVGFIEATAVSKHFATKFGYHVDSNQELIALGLANLTASIFGGYPVTGSLSRSAINAQSGAKTQFAAIITAAMVAATLLFFTRLFHYVPLTSLTAIIMAAVVNLVNTKEAKYLYKVKKTDFISWILTFSATIALGIEKGIFVSIVASLILMMRRTTHPHHAILGRLPRSRVYRNIERYPEAITLMGLIILRVDASLYFANAAFIQELFQRVIDEYKYQLHVIIFDASSINDVDSTADGALHEVYDILSKRNIKLYFTNVKGPVRDMFERSGFQEKVGSGHFFYGNYDAVESFLSQKFETKKI